MSKADVQEPKKLEKDIVLPSAGGGGSVDVAARNSTLHSAEAPSSRPVYSSTTNMELDTDSSTHYEGSTTQQDANMEDNRNVFDESENPAPEASSAEMGSHTGMEVTITPKRTGRNKKRSRSGNWMAENDALTEDSPKRERVNLTLRSLMPSPINHTARRNKAEARLKKMVRNVYRGNVK
jgi:hypothetical protein